MSEALFTIYDPVRKRDLEARTFDAALAVGQLLADMRTTPISVFHDGLCIAVARPSFRKHSHAEHNNALPCPSS